jgi:hypothetical protein
MIVSLGSGVSQSQRMPFQRPANAGFYKPQLVRGAFYSHLTPFVQTTLPIPAFRPNLPKMPRLVRPGYVEGGGGPNARLPAQQGPRPDVATMPAPIRGAFGRAFGFNPRPVGPRTAWFGADAAAAQAPAVQASQPVAPPMVPMKQQAQRLSPAQYRSPYDARNPYPARTMRTSVWTQPEATERGIRQGVTLAAETVNRSRWGTYNNRREIQNAIPTQMAGFRGRW